MGLSEGEGNDAEMYRRFEELCSELNSDQKAREEAWQSFQRIRDNYTLEGDGLHWLACSLYVSCRKSRVPTVRGGADIEGNCVSLTRLLRSTKLNLIEFFKKMKKWSDMASLPLEFRDKVDRLERNFAVSTVTFKKFEPIFLDIFCAPDLGAEASRQPVKGRKQKRTLCTSAEVFKFCWTMFVHVKGNFPAISDDLVNSYHLLLSCLDWFYANALLSNRTALINPDFSGLPKNYNLRDYKPPTEAPCIIKRLCEKHEGLLLEAKSIKEHWWKPYIRKLFDKKILVGDFEHLSGAIDIDNFERNSKAINSAYEEYVLYVGDFDERIFLGEDAVAEIGSPAAKLSAEAGSCSATSSMIAELAELRAQNSTSNWIDISDLTQSRAIAPSTPLTGRKYLMEKNCLVTPVSTATQGVSKLQTLLSGRRNGPSELLIEIFSKCQRNPEPTIDSRVKEMGKMFCDKYAQPLSDNDVACDSSVMNFAVKRLQLGESLYYKALEDILASERLRLGGAAGVICDFSNLLEQDIFHRSLFALCLEIVIFSYNSQRIFPWIIEIFDISSYYFYKVIELLIRAEDGLSRDVVKHLNYIEEMILESLAWKNDSPLWEALRQSDDLVPSVEDVSLPSQLERDGVPMDSSLPMHPAVNRISSRSNFPRKELPSQSSPVSVPSLADRFGSPVIAKRRLAFTDSIPSTSSAVANLSMNAANSSGDCSIPQSAAGPVQMPATMALITSKDGQQMLIPVKIRQQNSAPVSSSIASTSVATAPTSSIAIRGGGDAQSVVKPSSAGLTLVYSRPSSIPQPAPNVKPKRTGSLALFFRKVYHLASVRLRDICERLDIDSELCAQIWTCLEYCFIHHLTDLMCDRHIDQLIMCSIYVISKVAGKSRSFQEIMKAYRLQPQSESHVYRSVLLSSRKRRRSGDDVTGDNVGTSRSDSPAQQPPPNRKLRNEKGKAVPVRIGTDTPEKAIRSSSTLPAPQPSSAPPTPTRLAGTASTFQFEDRGEERGDVIKFYNMVYVNKVKSFALKFSSSAQKDGVSKPVLSPLPVVRSSAHCSPRKISANHGVYVSPHKPIRSSSVPSSTTSRDMTPQTKLLYCFNRSPARDLLAINNMLRGSDKLPAVSRFAAFTQGTSKRLPLADDSPTDSPLVKRALTVPSPLVGAAGIGVSSSGAVPGSMFHKRLKGLMQERQATNGSGQ